MLGIPILIVPGDTISWISNFTAYNSSDYTLSWAIRGNSSLDLIAVPYGNDFKTTITAIESETLTPGQYYYQAFLSDSDGDRVLIGSGQIQVVANLATATAPFDGRSEAQKLLDSVTAAILAITEGGAVKEYQIKDRKFTKQDLPELIKWRDKLKVEIAREQASAKIAQGLGDPRKLYTRFG